ncbi:DNA metabolism protein [Lithospermum erythrorhizon]|uniref:DNA metabolism protein n=1 Tax=Lithospermum erythrorhizon TaxID=34254 RepID=A0AAV3PJ28_LITER
MEPTNSSVFDSLKSEKISSKLTWLESEPNNPPVRARARTRRAIKELRQAAQSLQKPDPVTSSSSNKIPLCKQKSKSYVKLPEEYEILDNFFNGLDSAIRLLQLKRASTTFGNIVPKVECLTDRRFTYKHLAQLKFIFPDAIVMRKVLVRDERTSCMKPDLHITLNVNSVVEKGKAKSADGNGMLRKGFRSRLVDFFNIHPEGDEVPTASLPKPFDEPTQMLPKTQQEVTEGRLSATNAMPQATRTVMPTINLASSISETRPSSAISPLKVSTFSSSTPVFETPTKDVKLANSKDCFSPAASTLRTPAHLVSTPAKLMSATPSIQPPKRCYMTPDEESLQSPEKLARRPPRSRSLKFDTNVDEDVNNETSKIDDGILDVLPQDLLESIRDKERKVLIENDPAISQAKWRQKMIAKLPKFFDMVYFLFQSIKRSVITKEELVHKILSNNLDIIDKSEIEEHLALLKEIVPEWIYEKSASSGDLLFCINKIQSPQSIRSRIGEAT